MQVNSIRISVFAKEGENELEIEEKLKSLVPFHLEQEKIRISRQTATGFNEKKIRILELILTKSRHTKAFIESLKAKLGDKQKELLLRQSESRLDSEQNFYMRLDKEKLLNGECWLTDSGNCYHIKIGIATFPKSKEKALEMIEDMFGKG